MIEANPHTFRVGDGHPDRCQVDMIHADDTAERCVWHKDHLLDDSDHVDEHGHRAAVLVHQSTIDEAAHIGWLYPDGIHTREELRILEPGRRDYESPCPCRPCTKDREEKS